MDKRRVATLILLAMFLAPALLGIISAAKPTPTPGTGGGGGSGGGSSGGGSNGGFIQDLQTTLPVILLLLAILANRYDQRYALTLFAASMIVAAGLGLANANLPFFNPNATFVPLHVSVNGPTQLSVGQTVNYYVSYTPQSLPGSVSITWKVYLNGTYVPEAGPQADWAPFANYIQFTPNEPGTYMIIAIVNDSQAYAYGAGAAMVQVTNPPSGLGWLAAAFEGAAEQVLSLFEDAASGLIQAVTSLFGLPLEYALYSPTTNGTITSSLYSTVQNFAQGLAILFIAASVAYNAFKGNYADLVDIGADIFYKLGVWALFYSAGITIYNIAAGFINEIIQVATGPYLSLAMAELSGGSALYTGLFVADDLVPGVLQALSAFLGQYLVVTVVAIAIAVIRYSVILAIVALIPLWATLWIFEWTRGIAAIAIDLLIGAMVSGLVAAFILAIMATLPFGALLLLLGPLVGDISFVISLLAFAFSLKPGEHLTGSIKPKSPPSSSSQTQTQPAQPQKPQVEDYRKYM